MCLYCRADVFPALCCNPGYPDQQTCWSTAHFLPFSDTWVSFWWWMVGCLAKGWCLARPHCNTHATRLWQEGPAAARPGSSDALWTVACYFHEPRSNGHWGCFSHIQFCTLKRQTDRENFTMAELSLKNSQPLHATVTPTLQYATSQSVLHLMLTWKSLGCVVLLQLICPWEGSTVLSCMCPDC